MRLSEEQVLQDNNRFANYNALAELKYCGWEIPHRKAITNDNIRFYAWLCRSAVVLLKEHEVRELTIDEWKEWKNNPKRNPVCELWEHDTSPMWVLDPDTIHELALLMGKLKLFTGKPTLEQCKTVKWND